MPYNFVAVVLCDLHRKRPFCGFKPSLGVRGKIRFST